jgi:hypothetical protein
MTSLDACVKEINSSGLAFQVQNGVSAITKCAPLVYSQEVVSESDEIEDTESPTVQEKETTHVVVDNVKLPIVDRHSIRRIHVFHEHFPSSLMGRCLEEPLSSLEREIAFGGVFPIIWRKRLSSQALEYLVKCFSRVVLIVYAERQGGLVPRASGTILELIRQCGWSILPSAQVGAFKMMWYSHFKTEIPYHVPVSYGPDFFEEKNFSIRQYIHVEVTGPTVEDLRVSVGVPSRGVELNFEGQSYVFVQEKVLNSPMDVPRSVLHNWLIYYYAPGQETQWGLSDEEYYSINLAMYSTWSYPIHRAQVRQILPKLSPDTTVIAPADGVGIVARSWMGKKVCGDKNRTIMSDQSVKEETIMTTIRRGMLEEGSKVIILSYCSMFMDEGDLEIVKRTGVPVYILEARDVFRHKADHLGPGLFGWNGAFSCVNIVERVIKDRGQIPYSENLLNKSSFIFLSSSIYHDAFTTLRPLAPVSYDENFKGVKGRTNVADPSPLVPVLFATLEEYLNERSRFAKRYHYLAFLGVTEMEDVPYTGNATNVTLRTRQVYFTQSRTRFFELFKHDMLWAEKGGLVFFCFNYQVIEDLSLFRTSVENPEFGRMRLTLTDECDSRGSKTVLFETFFPAENQFYHLIGGSMVGPIRIPDDEVEKEYIFAVHAAHLHRRFPAGLMAKQVDALLERVGLSRRLGGLTYKVLERHVKQMDMIYPTLAAMLPSVDALWNDPITISDEVSADDEVREDQDLDDEGTDEDSWMEGGNSYYDQAINK